MNTKFYNEFMDKILESGLSKRGFAKKYDIGHAWIIEFTNPNKAFRPLQIKSMSLFHNKLGIDYEVMKEYNKEILEMRKNVSM